MQDTQLYQDEKLKQGKIRAQFANFEEVVFNLLAQVGNIGGMEFDVLTDRPKISHAYGYSKKIPQLKPKLKVNGAKSKPDAELI